MPPSWTLQLGNVVRYPVDLIGSTHCFASVFVLVARIALVSQDRARQIEAILLRMAQTGQLRGRVTEEQLIDLLEKVRMRCPACDETR